MKCPACGNVLKKLIVAGIEMGVCDGGCAGIWFGRVEFEKFDGKCEPDAETILRLKVDPLANVDFSKQRVCPHCEKIEMITHFVSIKRQVKIDECPKCEGIWLDAGELQTIRLEYVTQRDRENAAEILYDEMFGKQLLESRKKSEDDLKKIRRLASAFRFICPTFYSKSNWTESR